MATMKMPQKKSKGEELMAIILTNMGLTFIRQYRFHTKRKWLADFYLPEYKTILEVDGAVYVKGRHVRGKGYTDDRIRDNAATLMGYRVLRFTSWMVGSKARDTLQELVRKEEHADCQEEASEESEEQADRRRPRRRRPPLPT